MRYFQPQKIFIVRESLQDAFTQELLSRCPQSETEIIDSHEALIQEFRSKKDPFAAGKQTLLLMRKKGTAFKPFPLIPEYVSCHFQVFHIGSGCDLDCTYCVLQSYLNNPINTLYTNTTEMLEEMNQGILSSPGFVRVTTGELTDSLSMDHLTHWSKKLVPYFAKQKNAVLEFKTKSDNIACLEGMDPAGRVIVSWSVNAKTIQKDEEFKCATLDERIHAAERATQWGYRVGFHLDPLVEFPGWEVEYPETVRMIAERIPSRSIAWISLGTLRFMPDLKRIATERFAKSSIFTGEFIRGKDGKERYLAGIRKEMYAKVFASIKDAMPDVPVYLCMESPSVWNGGVQKEMANSEELQKYLDYSACPRES